MITHSTQRVELLVLRAWENVQGRDSAILGLAGVAIRAGATNSMAALRNFRILLPSSKIWATAVYEMFPLHDLNTPFRL
jgi:hypothetical protein